MKKKIKLSNQQLKSLMDFLENYFNFNLDIWKHFENSSDYKFIKNTIKGSIKILLEEHIINDLKFITLSILKTDDVLIPVCVLEDLIKD